MTFCFCSIYTGCNDVIKFDSISGHHVVGHVCMHCDAKIIEVADRRRYIDKYTSLGIENVLARLRELSGRTIQLHYTMASTTLIIES